MGYQFTNNWPYTYTLFPTMVDHTDPVNNAYFTGLHTEIENIEDQLGLNPSGDYASVKDAIAAALVLPNFEILQIETVRITADIFTNSNSFVDVTGATIGITTGANFILVIAHLNGQIYLDSSGAYQQGIVQLLEGANLLTSGAMRFEPRSNCTRMEAGIPLTYFNSISAGAKTIKLQWKVADGTLQYILNCASFPEQCSCSLTVIEIKSNIV